MRGDARFGRMWCEIVASIVNAKQMTVAPGASLALRAESGLIGHSRRNVDGTVDGGKLLRRRQASVDSAE